MDIPRLRLISQNIEKPAFRSVKDIIDRMGAMQAQDYNMVKWAVGLRLKEATEKVVEDALNNGDIIRTHVMRPTWHLVSADDIYWMLDLTSSRIKSSMKSRDKELELTPAVYGKSNDIIGKALAGGKHLLRKELIAELELAKIATANNRASHLFLRAELDGIICSGMIRGKNLTYALLEQRVPGKKKFSREESLGKLARKYFSSRFPATIEDFSWWSGLSLTDSRKAFEVVKSDFISEKIKDKFYICPASYKASRKRPDNVFILPAFDEFVISYKVRDEIFGKNIKKKAVSNNGIFRPVIVLNGQITGIWKRSVKNDEVIVETELYTKFSKFQKKLTESVFENYAKFLNKKLKLILN